MEIWKTIAWSPEQEQIIYREWGLFYTKKQILDIANLYYNKSLALNPEDSKALHFRSQCKRHIAQTELALSDAKKALSIDTLRQPFNLSVCDSLYELNEFEETKYVLTNLSRKFSGKKVDAFNNRIHVVNENFKDTIGNSLGYFILKNGKKFDRVYKEMTMKKSVDTRPLWKILKNENKCDILSIPETEIELLSPLEVSRRQQEFRIFNQNYLGRSWIDVLFLHALTTNQNLLLPQSQLSRPLLEILTKSKYHVVLKLLKMLHARSPLYTETRRKCPNAAKKAKHTDAFLSRIQYQVHRSMLKMLRHMHLLRESGKIEKLNKYVEEVMGDYVVLKTSRVMPWKFQFTNEVYNTLALALCDHFCQIIPDLSNVPPKDKLVVLFRLNAETEKKEPDAFEFGKRATHQNTVDSDKNLLLNKALTARLMKRLTFAKHPIEKAYLWYEIAKISLKENKFDRCCLLAERCISEANKCDSYIWMLHGELLICKTSAMLRKIEQVSTSVKKLMIIAKELRNPNLMKFLRLCAFINKSDVAAKRALRVNKSRNSMQSSSNNITGN